MDDIERCKEAKEKAKITYDATQPVQCPFFKAMVGFNSDGFHHIQYNGSGSERDKRVQIDRYRLFPLAPYIIKMSGTVQQYRKTIGPVGRKHKDGFSQTKVIQDWCFIALMNIRNREVTIKVVVRKIGDGGYNFFSIMPHKLPNYLFDPTE